jgi:hypothetical protein
MSLLKVDMGLNIQDIHNPLIQHLGKIISKSKICLLPINKRDRSY